MNSVCIIGRITKDIELRTTESGISCVSMYIALNNGKDQNGNERTADFPKVYVYDKQAENIAKYCKKGSLIGVIGKIKTRTWDKDDGSKGYETYIWANRIHFLESKDKENIPLPEPEYAVSDDKEEISKEGSDPFADFGTQIELTDDDLPF